MAADPIFLFVARLPGAWTVAGTCGKESLEPGTSSGPLPQIVGGVDSLREDSGIGEARRISIWIGKGNRIQTTFKGIVIPNPPIDKRRVPVCTRCDG
jgi:hypothetical protein